MRVLVVGATGVIGRRLVPRLLEGGHQVVALGRDEQRLAELGAAGAEPVAVDALDRPAFVDAVTAARADAAAHLLSEIPHSPNPRRFAQQMAATNRLRSEATRSLLEGCEAAGTERVVAAGLELAYEPVGGPVKDEDAPLWVDSPRQFRPVAEALVDLEAQVTRAGGAVLRFGHLYGEGTAYAADGDTAERVRKRRLPVIGDGGAVYSFIHADDAATATIAALTADASGPFNIVDDEPAPVSEWLPHFAAALGAPEPRKIPAPLVRPIIGEWGVAFMTALRGASNARAARELGWRPARSSWREGFTGELTELSLQ